MYLLKTNRIWDWGSVCILFNNGSIKLALCTKILLFLVTQLLPIMPCRFLNDLFARKKYHILYTENLTISNEILRVSSF